jgi:antitoxin CptB
MLIMAQSTTDEGRSNVQPTDRTRLRWRARRGLLENDLFIERFFSRHGDALTDAQVQGLSELLELSDYELLDVLMSRKSLEAAFAAAGVTSCSDAARLVLAQLQQSADRAGLNDEG